MKNPRDERGAIAVIVTILAVVLFGLTAFAVDLGSAWFRDREAQKQVDVSAISAAALLPATSTNRGEIADEVALQLNTTSNNLRGQAEVTGTQLLDTDLGNGEVLFPDENTMRVVAPPAAVEFTFAQIGNADLDSANVQREATVQLRTPIPNVDSVLPMWLTAGCMFGEVEGDTDTHSDPAASPAYTLNSPRKNHETGTISPATTAFASTPVSVNVEITNIPAGKTGAIIRFTFGDTQVVNYPVTFPSTTSGSARTVTVTLDAAASSTDIDVTSVAGDWEVWPLLGNSGATPTPGDTYFPKMNKQGKFTVTGGGETGCDDNMRGNFGQLDSPRQDGSPLQERYAKNVALGLDHELAQFVDAPEFECDSDGDPVGALIDNTPNRDGNNCIYAQPGNDPNGLTNGFIDGGSGYEGRLKRNVPNTPGCSGPTGGISGINNDVLSCFLKPGYSLDDIAQDDSPLDALDKAILESPRFFYVPVVYFETREEKKFLAIKTFVPVFLTDETRSSTDTSSDATSENGIQTNPAGKIQQIKLFAFSPRALPVPPNAETVDYDGTRGVLRLID